MRILFCLNNDFLGNFAFNRLLGQIGQHPIAIVLSDAIGNPRVQALHGGVTAAFMENAAMLHLLYQLDTARIPKSIDFAIDYLLPGRPQDLWADCEFGRIGSRVAQATVRCWQVSPAKPVAIARLHFLLAATDTGGA